MKNIFEAAKTGDVSALNELSKQENFDINQRDDGHRTAIMLAAENGDVDMLRVLDGFGANLDGAYLCENARWGRTVVKCAAGNGQVEVLRVLQELGANFDEKDYVGETAVQYAAINGHAEAIRVLKQFGATFDKDSSGVRTVVKSAVHQYQGQHLVEVLGVLKELGANLDEKDKWTLTAAMIVAKSGGVKAIRVLKQFGANLDEKDVQGRTAVMYAAMYNQVEVLKVLKELGANFDEKEQEGKTAVMFAARNGHVEALRVLLQFEAKFDPDGLSPEAEELVNQVRQEVVMEVKMFQLLRFFPTSNNFEDYKVSNAKFSDSTGDNKWESGERVTKKR